MFKPFVRRRLFCALAPVAAMFVALPASAQSSVESFYSGKRMHFIVGSAPGGAYDTYARIMVPYFTKYIPGNPNMIVENRPGGGGLLSSNHLYNVASKDGVVIGLVERGAPMDPILNPKSGNAMFDSRKFNWIGSPAQEVGLAMVREPSPIKSFEDFKKHEVMVSSTTRTGLASIYPRVMNGVFGTKFKVIEGYKSSTEMLNALERGEVNGHIAPSTSGVMRALISPWIQEGRVKVVLQLGLAKDGGYPEAELLTDLIKTDADRQLFDLMFAQLTMAYPIALPPGVPAERVAALRNAFDRLIVDPDFVASANRARLEIRPVTGLDLHKLLDQLYDTPQSVLDRYATLTSQ